MLIGLCPKEGGGTKMAIASWLTPASKSGTGNKTVNLTASKNPGASRTTIVTVSVNGITRTVECAQVEQDKFALKVSSTTLDSKGATITNIGQCSIGSSATGGVSSGSYYRDTKQTITAKAAPTGYSFIGWYEGSNLVSSSLQTSITMNAARTLVARYQIKTYAINASSENTNQGTVSPAGQTVEYGKNATVTATRKTGYTFDGWYEGSSKVSSNTTYTFAVTSSRTLVAKWKVHNVSFTVNIEPKGGGTVTPNPVVGQEGTLVNVTAKPNTGYNFKHWRYGDGATSTANPNSFTATTGRTDVTAVFVLKTYTVKWDANGGSVTPASISKTHGAALGTLPVPTRAATAEYTYTFAGWFTAASGGSQISESTTVTASVTYYAHWTATKRSYIVSFSGNGGGTPSPSSITKKYGEALGTLPTCSRTGYTFLGWYTASSGGSKISSDTTVTGTATYYAHWSIRSYTLTYNANGGSVTPASKEVQYGDTYGSLPTPIRSSTAQYTYTFDGWYTAASGGSKVSSSTTMRASDTTIYAHWTANTRSYTISYQTTYGTLNRTSQSVSYGSNGSCTLTMPSNNAQYTYNFVGWYTAPNGGGNKVGSSLALTTPDVTGSTTYYAYVTRSTNSYTHTFNGNGGGTPSPSSITKSYNSTLGTLPTVSRTGYTFVGWFDTSSTSGGTQATTSTKVTSSKTWYARWRINSYTWTFDANGGTGNTTKTLNYNATLSPLPSASRAATAQYTYSFVGWFDTSSSSGGTQLTTSTKCTGNKTWYARWTATTRSYKVTVTGNTGGTVSGGGTYAYNSSITIKATASLGYHFVKWNDGNTSASRTIKVTGDVTYTATFAQDPYLNLDKTSLEFEASGGTQTVKVTSNISWTVS